MAPAHRSPVHRLHVLVLVAALVAAGCAAPQPGTEPPGTPENGVDEPPVNATVLPAQPGMLLDLVLRQVYSDIEERTPRYRTPGSQGHAAAIGVLEGMLEERNLTVERETFQADLPKLGTVELTNLYGVREGKGPGEIYLAAHWDSRAWADGTTGDDCEGVGEPVLGANDGAAGVAVVVHALDLLPPTNATIRVALFDGEDQGCGRTGWAVGSQHAADALTEDQRDNLTALILVDMPGDKDLEIRREGYSRSYHPGLVDLVFRTAARLEAHAFIDEPGPAITDDHKPFLDRGVRAVDIIHLDKDPRRGPFPWTHHTVHDTPEHLSGENMAQVTDVVVATVMAIDDGALR